MKKLFVITLFNILLILLTSAYASAIRYDGPYEGKVIDAETGLPIERVVVLGEWSKEYPSPGGAVSEYYDAFETVTDKNGEFSIPGQGLLIFSNITPMDVLIFKAGHEYVSGSWRSLKVSYLYSTKIKWDGNKAIIPLRKLTMAERKKEGIPSRPSIPLEKMKLMTEEISKERVEQGLKPFRIER